MNVEFLQKLGINDENPNVILNKLGAKEIELLDKKDLAEVNGADNRVKEIESLLEQLKVEREVVKEEAKSYIPKKEETIGSKESARDQSKKKSAAYEKIVQKKKDEVQKAQQEVQTSATKSGAQQKPGASNTSATKSGSQQKPGASNTSSTQSGSQQKTGVSNTTTLQNATLKSTTSASSQKNVKHSSQKPQSKNNKAAVSVSAQKTTNAPAQGSSGSTGEFSTGLRYYQKQDFDNAFKCFYNVAENKNVADSKAERERTQASYLLAVMYRNGEATKKDLDRSMHYLKRAADFGYLQAQLEYGELILSQHLSSTDMDLKARKEGWEYIEKAADAGLDEAIKKYIDLAKTSADTDKHIIAKAKAYIPVIKNQLDSYEAQKCDDWITELNDTEKATKKKASYPKKFIIGEILFLIGTIYLFKGLNPIFFENVIPHVNKFIPNIPEFLIIKWDKLVAMTDPYMTHQGIFGGWLIILGNLIRGLGVKKIIVYNGKYIVFGKVVRNAIIILCVAHFIANIMETKNFFGNGSYMQVLAMVACIMIGRILGCIAYKIIK